MSEDSTRISVSRDALRAELAEMELRLRIYFDKRFIDKADKAEVLALAARLQSIDRGEMTASQTVRIKEIVRDERRQAGDDSWTTKERFLYAFGGVSAAGMLVLAFIAAFGGVHG